MYTENTEPTIEIKLAKDTIGRVEQNRVNLIEVCDREIKNRSRQLQEVMVSILEDLPETAEDKDKAQDFIHNHAKDLQMFFRAASFYGVTQQKRFIVDAKVGHRTWRISFLPNSYKIFDPRNGQESFSIMAEEDE